MLSSVKIPDPIQDIIKVLIGIKLIVFVVFSAVESIVIIRDGIDYGECVDEFEIVFKSLNSSIPKAKAVHTCAGGNIFVRQLKN